eukprot:7564311-Alexandrium_andersonii.AAC.1
MSSPPGRFRQWTATAHSAPRLPRWPPRANSENPGTPHRSGPPESPSLPDGAAADVSTIRCCPRRRTERMCPALPGKP